MKWVELSVETPPEYVEPLVEVFRRYGRGGVAVEQAGGFNPDEGEAPPTDAWVTVRTYLPQEEMSEERRARLDVAVRLVAHLVEGMGPLRERLLEEDEWAQAWKRHLGPLRVGRRLAIVPSWTTYRPRPEDVVLRLDPGMAFGTGHHPTTRLCLALVEELVKEGDAVLDVGTGSGVLSMAAVRLGARRAVALDVDPVAVRTARANLRENGLAHRVAVFEGTLPHAAVEGGGFDLALANISAKVVMELAPHLASALRPGGRLVASGLLEERAEEVEERLASEGLRPLERRVDGDWVALVALRVPQT